MSATTRMVVDSMRTIIVWSVSLAVGWQPVDYHSILIQLGGFALLIAGMFIYNDLIFAPFLRRRGLLRTSVQADARPGEMDAVLILEFRVPDLIVYYLSRPLLVW